jgi:hypothetical protein
MVRSRRRKLRVSDATYACPRCGWVPKAKNGLLTVRRGRTLLRQHTRTDHKAKPIRTVA